ncbi:CBS domain-containing protein [Altererythrobacter sp. MTPC7]|uniref:CBS domain-containing protein n=1 Tax=Altererythrobacter sp. MTPC7 TaxID=3056567 RepID=UPI0036F2E8B2|nr:CBS domain-containing protein [Erythrobacteraceae bacterium WH01K]
MLIEGITAQREAGDILTCEARLPVREAVAMLAGKRIGALPVVEDGRVLGIFSERDVIYRLADEGEACLARPVGEVMTSPAITITSRDRIDDALALMSRRRIRHLPVVDDGRFVGFVSIGDIVKSRIDEVESEAATMRTYIQSA